MVLVHVRRVAFFQIIPNQFLGQVRTERSYETGTYVGWLPIYFFFFTDFLAEA